MSRSSILPIATPNPFFEGVNTVYLLRGEPVTLIDTGVATDEGFAALLRGLQRHRVAVDDIQRIVLTHRHIDHIGNAWRIQQDSGAEIFIHAADASAVTQADTSGDSFRALAAQRLVEWRVPDRDRSELLATSEPHWQIKPAAVRELTDGEVLEQEGSDLDVIHTPGHTLGSVCLRRADSLFTGDHILAEVSPNIGGGDLAHRGLLRHYLNSLDLVQESSGRNWLGLPGHGSPLERIALRCEELKLHHEQRLEQAHQVLLGEPPQSVYAVALALYGKLESFHIVLGCAEAEAHLNYLEEEGRVRCEGGLYSAV